MNFRRVVSGLYYRVSMAALSWDEHTVAIVEQTKMDVNGGVETWVVLADGDTERVKHRLSLSNISTDIRRFELRFVDQNRAVVV